MSDTEHDFDLDEDLFDFDEILGDADASDKVDLEELLRVLEAPDPGPMDVEEHEDELIGADEPAAAPHAHSAAPELRPATGPGRIVPTAAPVAAPAAPTVAAPAAPAMSTQFARVALIVFAGLALLNVVSVGLSWERGRDVSSALDEMERRFLESTGDLRQELFHQSSAMERQRMPIVAPTGDASVLDQAASLVREGKSPEARRRVYSLLSVVDRYDPDTRAELEGRAAYLLADSWMAEADEREVRP